MDSTPCSRTRRNTLPLEQRSAFRMRGIIHPKRGIQRSNDSSSKKHLVRNNPVIDQESKDPKQVCATRSNMMYGYPRFPWCVAKAAGKGSLPSLRSARWVFEVCEALRGSWCWYLVKLSSETGVFSLLRFELQYHLTVACWRKWLNNDV